jgi:hypothetical protein
MAQVQDRLEREIAAADALFEEQRRRGITLSITRSAEPVALSQRHGGMGRDEGRPQKNGGGGQCAEENGHACLLSWVERPFR